MQIFTAVLQSNLMPLWEIPEEHHDASEIQILADHMQHITTGNLGSGITSNTNAIFTAVLQSNLMPLWEIPEEHHNASEIQILADHMHHINTGNLGSGITEKGLFKAVLHVAVDQHLLASIDAAAMQFG